MREYRLGDTKKPEISIQFYDKNHESTILSNPRVKKHFITTDLSVAPKDNQWHLVTIVKKSSLEELCYVDGRRIPYALLS